VAQTCSGRSTQRPAPPLEAIDANRCSQKCWRSAQAAHRPGCKTKDVSASRTPDAFTGIVVAAATAQTESSQVRVAAVEALARLRVPTAGIALRDLVHGNNRGVCVAATIALGQLAQDEVTRRIARYCGDYSLVRRPLIMHKFMTRDHGTHEFTELGKVAWRVEYFILDRYLMPRRPPVAGRAWCDPGVSDVSCGS